MAWVTTALNTVLETEEDSGDFAIGLMCCNANSYLKKKCNRNNHKVKTKYGEYEVKSFCRQPHT